MFTVSTLPGVRSHEGFDRLLDGWLQGGAYVTIAVLAALGARAAREDRGFWRLVAGALALRALGFVVFLAVVRELEPQPYPSIADAAWLAMCALLIAALVAFVRQRLTTLSAGLLLDGIIGALAVTAIAVAFLDETVEDLTATGTPRGAVATNVAYPIADVLLLLVILGVFVAYSWRPPRALWLLGAGVVGFAVVDTVFLSQIAAGTFRPGSWLASTSLIATAAIGWAPSVRDAAGAPAGAGSLPRLLMPTLFAVACLAVMVAASIGEVAPVAVVLATAGLLLAIARTGLTFRDVRLIAEARRDARTDELTGAANRRAFNEELARALRDRRPDDTLALLVLDLDNFKDINDSLGHHYGDELLKLVTPRLRVALRSGDLLARIGGDEFAALVPDADAETAARVAERLHAALRRPFALAGRQISAEASVGIALFPHDGREASELLKNADLAMYDAKASPAAHQFFRADHHRTTRERLASVDRLRRGIAEGELVLHYQPQVQLLTGEVAAVEALVRWQHPTEGLLPPGRFLPLAESGGLMRALSLDVLEQAIRQCAAWRRDGRRVIVSVNLSVTNLLDAELPDRTATLLDRYELPGDALVVEVTEDLFMADPSRGGRVIHELVETGARIAVDDYGTGFSSLGYLRDLRDVSQLKLDRSFVTGLAGDRRAQAIVRSTIELARSLGLELIAEGVETEEECEALVDMGCEIAQGFYFARPGPAEAVPVTGIARGASAAGFES